MLTRHKNLILLLPDLRIFIYFKFSRRNLRRSRHQSMQRWERGNIHFNITPTIASNFLDVLNGIYRLCRSEEEFVAQNNLASSGASVASTTASRRDASGPAASATGVRSSQSRAPSLHSNHSSPSKSTTSSPGNSPMHRTKPLAPPSHSGK